MPRRMVFATFAGSFLLFVVQPMVARLLLPATGGVPSLWNTCMVFFQVALLGGYGYAHASGTRLPPWPCTALHAAFVVAAACTLPLALHGAPSAGGDPSAWVLAFLARRVGPVFLALAAGAPLLQLVHERSRGAGTSGPLLAASNAGSLGALLAYPLLVEPWLDLGTQLRAFAVAFGLYAVLVVTCLPAPSLALADAPAAVPRNDAVLARVAVLAAVPVSMMLGVTTHLATDVGSFPLLWIVPLALYLGSFVAVFARTPTAPGPRFTAPFLGSLVLMFLFTAPQVPTRAPLVVGHLAVFAASAWMLHGEISRLRSSAGPVTAFQLAVAGGGVVGGVLTALVAPRVFLRVSEYPLAMAAVVLLTPSPPPPPDPRDREERLLRSVGIDPDAVLGPRPPPRPAARAVAPSDALVALGVGALAAALFVAPAMTRAPSLVRLGPPLVALVLLSIGRRARLALGLVAILAAARYDRSVVYAARTFYGVLRVDDVRGVRRFLHGTTLHGLEYLSPKVRGEPIAYYARSSPIGDVMTALGASLDGRTVGVVGLGCGMLLAHARPAQRWTFYELDPAVARVARRWFSWLAASRAPWSIVIGDARRTLDGDRTARHGLLVLDAFSSDAIPTHLLTREAFAVWRSRLDDHGVIAVHVTNRHVALGGVVAAVAADAGLRAWIRTGRVPGPDDVVTTTWVVLARSAAEVPAIAADPRWSPLVAAADTPVWTDGRADVLRVLRWR